MKPSRNNSRSFLVARRVATEHALTSVEDFLSDNPYESKRKSIIDQAKKGSFPEQRHILGDTQTFQRSFSKESTSNGSAKNIH